MCYVVVWQHVIGMVCVLCVVCCLLCAVLSATHPTQHTAHSAQYTHHTYDMLPHHHITHNDVVFLRNFILI